MAKAYNHGASVPDIIATGPAQETLSQWRSRANIDQSNHIKIVKLAHMRYQHPDLKEITEFLEDFGMTVAKQTEDEVWYQGYGKDQYVYYARKGPRSFLGGSFEVESYGDLEKAAKLEGASQIETMADAPGGGFIVTLTDPEGVSMNLIYGQTPKEASEEREKLIFNYEREKPRVRKFLRFEEGPAAIHKVRSLGFVLEGPTSSCKLPSKCIYTDKLALIAWTLRYLRKGFREAVDMVHSKL